MEIKFQFWSVTSDLRLGYELTLYQPLNEEENAEKSVKFSNLVKIQIAIVSLWSKRSKNDTPLDAHTPVGNVSCVVKLVPTSKPWEEFYENGPPVWEIFSQNLNVE